MFEPERMIGDGLDLVGGFQHPTLAPAVNDPIAVGRGRDKAEWNFQDDGVDVYAGLAISAVVDKSEIAIRIFGKLIPIPREWAGRQLSLVPVISPFRIVWIAVEKVIAFELDQSFGNLQLPGAGHRVRHVIELRRVID